MRDQRLKGNFKARISIITDQIIDLERSLEDDSFHGFFFKGTGRSSFIAIETRSIP